MSEEVNEPKRHHVVPRFYLQRFADKDDTIDVVRRDDTKISFRRTPESALFVREFYSLETDDGLDRYAERFFASDIETNGARAIRRLV